MTEWKTYKLEDIIDKVIDNRGKSAPTSDEKYSPIIEINSIGDRNPNYDVVRKWVSKDTYDTWFRSGHPMIGDILIPTVGTIGIVSMMRENKGCIAQNIVALRTNEKAHNLYLYYLLKSEYVKQELLNLNIGGVQPSIKVPHLLNLEISLPGLEEQRRIAGILGAIDDKIENNRRINTNLELQAQALYKQWFVDNCSNDWETIKLGDIIEISKKSITPAQSENTIFEHYSLPAFDDGIQPVFEKGKDIKSSKFIVEQNMFLFSKLNPRIKRIWLPNIQTENAICSTEFIPYKPKDGAMFGFCYSIVNSDSFYEYVLSLTNGSTGSHQRFHPIDTLDYELMIPNNDYIAKFEELVMPIYRTIARNRMECKNLATLRDTLLPKLMNGEIKVAE